MPTLWNDTEDRNLLLAVISVAAPAPPDWGAVTAALPGKTREAVRQRYQKLKKMASADSKNGSPEPDDEKPKTPKTKAVPVKRKRAGTAAGATKVKGEDDEEAEEPATKKRATKATKKGKASVAPEDEAEGDLDLQRSDDAAMA